jgi:hypothetical protein
MIKRSVKIPTLEVRYGSQADPAAPRRGIRCCANSGHGSADGPRPLRANRAIILRIGLEAYAAGRHTSVAMLDGTKLNENGC